MCVCVDVCVCVCVCVWRMSLYTCSCRENDFERHVCCTPHARGPTTSRGQHSHSSSSSSFAPLTPFLLFFCHIIRANLALRLLHSHTTYALPSCFVFLFFFFPCWFPFLFFLFCTNEKKTRIDTFGACSMSNWGSLSVSSLEQLRFYLRFNLQAQLAFHVSNSQF